MLEQSEIQQYGGKAAILNHITAKLPDMPVPRYVVKQAGQDLASILPEFSGMKTPVIVRSSSPHEYASFEGIFDSVDGVHNEQSLESAVRIVEESAMSERAQRYAAIHGFSVDEQMHVIVQEQSPSTYLGAMMRHPNNPDLVFITCFSGRGRFQQHYSGSVFNEKTGEREGCQVAVNEGLSEDKARFLVDKYKELESLKDLADGEVLYVEFGLSPFMLYQARPFKKIETAEFDLPEEDRNSGLHTNLAFGITPPEGIVLPVLRSVGYNEFEIARESADHSLLGAERARIQIAYGDSEMDWAMNMMNLRGQDSHHMRTRELFAKMMEGHHSQLDEEIGGAYCFLTSSAKREDYEVDLTIPNMRTLALGQAQSFLTHGLMRLIKQADVTFAFGPALVASEFYKGTKTREHKVRIISNGKEAVAMRE